MPRRRHSSYLGCDLPKYRQTPPVCLSIYLTVSLSAYLTYLAVDLSTCCQLGLFLYVYRKDRQANTLRVGLSACKCPYIYTHMYVSFCMCVYLQVFVGIHIYRSGVQHACFAYITLSVREPIGMRRQDQQQAVTPHVDGIAHDLRIVMQSRKH